jgi:putative hydrolase of the HAD superfamily
MIQAVIFDLDNTLTDFGNLKNEAIRSAIISMQEAGLELEPQEAFDRIMSIYSELGWEYQQVLDSYIIENCGYLDYKYLAAGIVGYRRGREAALAPYQYVQPTLIKLLRQGLRLGVVSDAPSREAWMRLVQLNFHHLFDAVVTFDDTGERKPHPAPFQKILEKLNVKAQEAIMVGDWAERDMLGAKRLGMVTVFARYGDLFSTGESGADFEIERFDQLCHVIEQCKEREL